ncbi:HAMP domain-containing sensor histidine kinase [Phytoactinopolyspora halotolerans]|uniref:histidine kinase n=1 Tax=Phytoactinopolyspora halotolerans TaxID=1981512 RepID=A0A6L9S6H3_9ACTN|nr:HAMP domain-containing sensor histidine kinase [Phytoactinopolyspora halotolerans]NEE00617.1 HAMP domain-containing histidine kinase [Phytoactinopolyspora halotolerans]
MPADRPGRRGTVAQGRTGDTLGPLGRRLLVAFILVAVAAVAVLTLAALIGADLGLTEAGRQMRHMAGHSGEMADMVGAAAVADGRVVAWWWIGVAAVVALAVAVGMSWFVSRRLTTPLIALAGAARAFASGDRSARVGLRGPGELGDVAEAFDGMADDLARAEAARRRMTSDVAHELRTPLTALQAQLEELRDGYAEPDAGCLSRLHDQALRLGRVVDDLATLAAAESAALSLERTVVDLGVLAADALAAHRSQLRSAGLDVRPDITGPVPVYGDPDRLHQAIGNLLANAARYCRPGDRVSVYAGVEAGDAVIRVADTGPGIPAEDQPHVFDRWWTARHGTAAPGSGIGLAVVREVVTAHGGTVHVESASGEGSTFTIAVPLHHA